MIYSVEVYVTHKDSVLGPQGEVIKKIVRRIGCETVEDICTGKYFEIQPVDTGELIDIVIEMVRDELPANVDMETYRYEIEKMEEVQHGICGHHFSRFKL